jgi:cytochrome b6-f complex iron-sulfur subunit
LPDPTRRTMMCGLLVGLVTPAALAACSSSSKAPAPSPAPAQGGSASGVTLAKLSDVPVGGGVIVTGPSGKVLLTRPTENEVIGLDPTCPHAGVQVQPPKGGTITCPGHGSTFAAATGDLKGGPATTGLTRIAVKVSGDSVVTA